MPPQTQLDVLLDVPCFKCLVNKEIAPFFCNPAKCKILEKWLFKMVKQPEKSMVTVNTH